MRISPINNASFKGLEVKCKFEGIPNSLDDCETEVFDKNDIIGIKPCLRQNCALLKYKPNPSKELDFYYVPLDPKRPMDSYNSLLTAYVASTQTDAIISPCLYE